jgi:MinD-like ATPase involved in chromosome partitioning or flagellar assembly
MPRILTVASGKGGVGKTTFAVNFAMSLSRVAPTILVDLDTGTSSVRHSIDAPVTRDLYHFLRKNHPLSDCVTHLSENLDPRGLYRGFGFIASPRHLIDETTHFGEKGRRRLAEAINSLPAQFIVIDLKAGLDHNVIDFLPYRNSGILVFTPEHPAATLAASDIVKAILFRQLRILFGERSPFYQRLPPNPDLPRTLADLLDRAEDVYDDSIANLDAFLVDLRQALGDHPIIGLIGDALTDFRVFCVLNMFNGIEESFETAIAPFVSNIVENVSERIRVMNLGWIIASEQIHESNCRRRPLMLGNKAAVGPRPAAPRTRAERELAALEDQYLGAPTAPANPVSRALPENYGGVDRQRHLEAQMEALRLMFADQKGKNARANFEYIANRALHLVEGVRRTEFGAAKIETPEEFLRAFFADHRLTPVE